MEAPTPWGDRPNGGWKWEKEGDIGGLLCVLISDMGQLIGMQLLLVLHVVIWRNALQIVPCTGHSLRSGLVCSWTKAFVRFFPLLAFVVLLVLIARLFLRRRLYYQLLRRGILLDFENHRAPRDPFFWILIFCAVNAFLHFAVTILESEHLYDQLLFWSKGSHHGANSTVANSTVANSTVTEDLDRQRDMTYDLGSVMVAYVIPLLWFMTQLVVEYDTEKNLIPISKYFEEDPDVARRALTHAHYLLEPDVAAIVRGGLSFRGQHRDECTMDDVVAEILRRLGEGVQSEPKMQHDMTSWRLIGSVWPAAILLDSRLSDDESRNFRALWAVFSVLSFVSLLGGTVGFLLFVVTELAGLILGFEWWNIAGLLVEVLGLLFCAKVAHSLVTHARMGARFSAAPAVE